MFTKIALTLALIAIVWYGFRFVSRVNEVRRKQSSAGPGKQDGMVQDMVKCPVCGVWQAGRGTASCGRGECPY